MSLGSATRLTQTNLPSRVRCTPQVVASRSTIAMHLHAPTAGSVDVRIDDEWSFAETLRHLVHGTDLWLGKAVLGLVEADFHPLGLGYGSRASEAVPYDDVLAARADRAAMVRDFLATVTEQVLDEERRNPHDPARAETVRHCLHVILREGWEHLRFALRDLDTVEARLV